MKDFPETLSKSMARRIAVQSRPREERVPNEVEVVVKVNGMHAITAIMHEGIEPWQVVDYLNKVVDAAAKPIIGDEPIVVELV